MTFGVCTTLENSAMLKDAGWDFVEERIDQLLEGNVSDVDWTGAQRAAKSVLPIYAANCLVPGAMKITGPDASPERLERYIANVMSRARQVGLKRLVFGSGGARNVPEGFDRDQAKAQIVDFARMAATHAQQHGVTLVLEHLVRKECNIINSVEEAMTYVRQVNHPSFRCLLDSYHFWASGEPLASLGLALPYIAHVHVADKDGRVAPGLSGTADYRPLFRQLKEGGYDGGISVEAGWPDLPGEARRVLAYLKDQWTNC